MKLLSIGSVIEVAGTRLMVMGYTAMPKESHHVCGYYTVPWPIGYLGVKKLFFIPASREMTVIAGGYDNLQAQALRQTLGQHLDLAEKTDPQVYGPAIRKTMDLLRQKKGEAQT